MAPSEGAQNDLGHLPLNRKQFRNRTEEEILGNHTSCDKRGRPPAAKTSSAVSCCIKFMRARPIRCELKKTECFAT